MPRPIRALAALCLLGALTLAGCTSTVSLQPAAAANDPACAAVMVRLPATVDGQDRRWTDAQSTASWGDPTSVILTCGVTPPGATTLPCQSPGGVDWIIDDSEAPHYRFTTFGRTPAIEVYLDYDVVSGNEVLERLATAVSTIPQTGGVCTDKPAT